MWANLNSFKGKEMKEVKNADLWDERKLGASLEHARLVDEKMTQDLDAALGMKMISLRLPEELIQAYKLIATHHEIGYQPLMRDILQRFIKEGMREVVEAQERKSDEASQRINDALDRVA